MWATKFVHQLACFSSFLFFIPPFLPPSLPPFLSPSYSLFFGLPSLAGFSDDWKILSRKNIYEMSTLNLK